MWVLEARKDAEKVWYPVVWEEIKDASNVVDYDIRDEETKDTSAMINSNNQTTTGMATVIPWVNAPKLIASTSVIWYETNTSASISGSASGDWWVLKQYTNFTYNSKWNLDYWSSNNSLTIPSDWEYKIEMTWWDQQQWASPTTWYTNTFYIKKNWETIASWVSAFRLKWTIWGIFTLSRWDVITFRTESTIGAYGSWSCSIVITKL
jgi:hypothetical protein